MKVIWWWVDGGGALVKNQDISELRSSWSISLRLHPSLHPSMILPVMRPVMAGGTLGQG